MDIPINYPDWHWPMREKYLDEECAMLNRWFIFGKRADGSVDICDGDRDIFTAIPCEKAEKIIEARDVFCNAMLKALNG